ncbi:MAG: hypothetical protein AB7S38_09950 [Vulcanimicrobiota bacterium]
MFLTNNWMHATRSLPPGRHDKATGQYLHYLEVRNGLLESQERHGTVLVEQDQYGHWHPLQPRDAVTLTDKACKLGFWRDGLGPGGPDGKVDEKEVLTLQEAYPNRKDWHLELWADHAKLTFNGKALYEFQGPPTPPAPKPKKKSNRRINSHTDPLSLVSHRFVSLLERRIPTSFGVMDDQRRQRFLASLEPGDVILETNLAYPGWKQFEHYALQSNYTHAALYEGNGKFLEATPHGGVQRSDIEKYLNDTVKVAVIKMPYASEADRQAALDNFRAIRGKPYNRTPNFLSEEHPSAFGCTEAVTYSLENIPNPIKVPRTEFATGHTTVSPAAFFKVEGAVVKFDDQADYFDDQRHSWPVGGIGAVSGLTTGLVAHSLGLGLVGSTLAGLVGGALGYYTSVCTGNWLQKGQFKMFVDGK